MYYKYSSTQLRLPAGSVLVWTKLRVHVYIHRWILSLLFLHIVAIGYVYVSNIYCRYSIYIYMRLIYIHVLPIVVYSTPLACWECVCMDEVACSIYTYCTTYLHNSACQQGVCVCGQSRYLIRIYVSDIHVHIEHILPQFVYSTPLANRECDCVDKVACSTYVYASVVWILSLPYIHIVAI